MPQIHYLDDLLTTTLTFANQDSVYVARQGTVRVFDGPGVARVATGDALGYDMTVLGEISALSSGPDAIGVSGRFETLSIGPTGIIYGNTIGVGGGAFSIINEGYIKSAKLALRIEVITNVVNTGTITGRQAISYDPDPSVEPQLHLFNAGVINGEILLPGGPDTIVNNGLINGNINLGGGSNVYDGRLGIVQGDISLGSGSSTFYGGRGSENVRFDSGTHLADGGEGVDKAIFTTEANATVDLRSHAPQDLGAAGGIHAFKNFENVLVDSNRPDIVITIIGDDGDNTLEIVDGGGVLDGGLGNDVLRNLGGNFLPVTARFSGTIGAVADLKIAGAQNTNYGLDRFVGSITGLEGGSGADRFAGDDDGNILIGNDGDDSLEGGLGRNTLEGGQGNDTAVYLSNAAKGAVVDLSNVDFQETGYGLDRLDSIENLMGGAGGDTLKGNGSNNILSGDGGNDTIDAGAGDDKLIGGLGNDSLTGGDDNDTFVAGFGNDTMNGGTGSDTVDYSGDIGVTVNRSVTTQDTAYGSDVVQGIENVIGSSAADILTGDGASNILTGGGGDDVLDGGSAADRLIGGTGGDTYRVDHADDLVVEDVGEGIDRIVASVTYAMRAGTEVETLQAAAGQATIHLTGNEFANTLLGNDANNRLQGGAGADVLDGGLGDDTLDGGTGDDRMTGGGGDDTYFIDSAADVIVEAAGGGNDTAIVSLNFRADALTNVETIKLADDTVANRLTGGAGSDHLVGNGAFNILDGGAGADRLVGGAGSDVFIVDNAGDVVVEGAGGGIDAVQTTISYVLAADTEVEFLTALGAGAIDLTGNAIANTLSGNAASNILDGGGGADRLEGAGGNDTYLVDNAGDLALETAGAGYDIVRASISYTLAAGSEIEVLAAAGSGALDLTGNAFANAVTGNAAANLLRGEDGDDILSGDQGVDKLFGGLGRDVLNGGAGKDSFVLDTAVAKKKNVNIDTFADFSVKDDSIWLDNAIYKALGKKGTLTKPWKIKKAEFYFGSKAHDRDDHLIVAKDGKIFYDSDGSGKAAQIQIAAVSKKVAKGMTEKDFFII